MPKWETVKAGDILWDVHREKMGSTTMSRLGSWEVAVIEIHHAEGWALTSWNGNLPRRTYRRTVEKYRRSPAKERVHL